MKKLLSFLPLLALVLAVAGAFAMKPAPKNTQVLTYYFTGSSGEEFEADKYSTTGPSGGCSGHTLTCEFEVPNGFTDISDYMNWLNAQDEKQSLYDLQVISQRD
ncbi:MAG TPA: DUF6520 family protein [Sediminibacterium sp.]|nr:DUF6520 family protein [Sediminibacterium sp.]